MINNKVLGSAGEKMAVDYLKKNKYKILECNYVNKVGEIDIICFDKKTNTYVFVEVKTRTTLKHGYPREAVNNYKQNKIKSVATIYAMSNNIYNEKIRFDVIEILNNELTHIVNAF